MDILYPLSPFMALVAMVAATCCLSASTNPPSPPGAVNASSATRWSHAIFALLGVRHFYGLWHYLLVLCSGCCYSMLFYGLLVSSQHVSLCRLCACNNISTAVVVVPLYMHTSTLELVSFYLTYGSLCGYSYSRVAARL